MVISDAVQTLERELREIFGSRLQSLVVYGQRARPAHHAPGGHGHAAPPTHTLAIVGAMTPEDLRACALHVEAWHGAGLATPLLIADHAIVAGANPFASLAVDPADLRRACEVQARSHLLHLREGFLETRGRADALSVLVLQSAAAFASLVTSIARLEGHSTDDAASAARHVERILGTSGSAVADVTKLAGARDISSADAERLFAPYLEAVTRIVRYVDGWNSGS